MKYEILNVTCKNCGKEFELKSTSKYREHCSKSCLNELRDPEGYNNVECALCGKRFHLKPYRLKRSKNNYCSTDCKNTHKSELYSGRNNPNCKYSDLKDDFFSVIDSEEKAYLLGWIASDGSIRESGFTVTMHKKDIICMGRIKDIIYKEIEIKPHADSDCLYFSVNSKQISRDLCEIFNIKPKKKSDVVCFPDTDNIKYFPRNKIEMGWHFLRGYFDGDGHVRNPTLTDNPYPECDIASNSIEMLRGISKFTKSGNVNKGCISWCGNNALDFMGKLYDNASCYLERKRNTYQTWLSWVPSLSGNNSCNHTDGVRFSRTDKCAKIPCKSRVSDSGYDLTAIKIHKVKGDVILFDTGIKVRPPFGWYFDLVPRSSIIKTGYVMANSIGVIDRTYIGNILIPLIRISKDTPDIELPSKIAQLIPRPIIHFNFIEVEELEDTERGYGGFGSTDIVS